MRFLEINIVRTFLMNVLFLLVLPTLISGASIAGIIYLYLVLYSLLESVIDYSYSNDNCITDMNNPGKKLYIHIGTTLLFNWVLLIVISKSIYYFLLLPFTVTFLCIFVVMVILSFIETLIDKKTLG